VAQHVEVGRPAEFEPLLLDRDVLLGEVDRLVAERHAGNRGAGALDGAGDAHPEPGLGVALGDRADITAARATAWPPRSVRCSIAWSPVSPAVTEKLGWWNALDSAVLAVSLTPVGPPEIEIEPRPRAVR